MLAYADAQYATRREHSVLRERRPAFASCSSRDSVSLSLERPHLSTGDAEDLLVGDL